MRVITTKESNHHIKVCFVIQYICSIEAWTNESFNMAESAWLQYMSSVELESQIFESLFQRRPRKAPYDAFSIVNASDVLDG